MKETVESFILFIVKLAMVFAILRYILKTLYPLLTDTLRISNRLIRIKQYGGDYKVASKVIVVTTLLGGITIPILAQML